MTNIPAPQPAVVVGVDGSPSSLEALDYAAAWAARTRAPLRLVHAFRPTQGFAPQGWVLPPHPAGEHIHSAVQKWMRDLAEQAGQKHPGLIGVQTVQSTGNAAAVLINESGRAAVTMVGCRGIGGFTELMLGSTSAQVSTHGYGPVIVVRPRVAMAPGPQPQPPTPLGPVLACYDGSPAAEAALRFAAGEAAVRDVPLIVANAYDGDETAAKQLLVEAVDTWADDLAGCSIELLPVSSQHRLQYALVEATRVAALTVVGCRGRGGFAGLLLGSVSRTLVHHAYGPVAVIHPAEYGKE